MFGQSAGSGFAWWILLTIATWAMPLLLLVWLIRSVNAMVAAQRQIAEHLAIIAADLRARWPETKQ